MFGLGYPLVISPGNGNHRYYLYIYNANSNAPRLLTGGRVSCTLALRQHRLTRVKAETVRVNPHEPENYESGPADGIDQAGIYIYIYLCI